MCPINITYFHLGGVALEVVLPWWWCCPVGGVALVVVLP